MSSRNGALTPEILYNELSEAYGGVGPGWWPGDPYTIMVTAVLVQNVSWRNVEKSVALFGNELTPEWVSGRTEEELVPRIRPCGFYTAKARTVLALTEWYGRYGYDVPTVQKNPPDQLRRELLAIRGIGEETADAVLLYAFHFPTFVIDAYTRRFFGRMGLDPEYGDIRKFFTDGLPKDADLYARFHALILDHGKNHCGKRPSCAGCVFADQCTYFRERRQ